MGSLLSETFSTGVVCGIRNPEFGIRNSELVYFKEFGIRNWCILRNSKTFKIFHF